MIRRALIWAVMPAIVAMPMAVACQVDADSDGDNPASSSEGPCPTKQASLKLDDDPTVREALELMAEGFACPGHVAHIVVRNEPIGQSDTATAEGEYWVDMSRGVMRRQPGSSEDSTGPEARIITADGQYYLDSSGSQKVAPPDCLGEELIPIVMLLDDECVLFAFGGLELGVDEKAELDGETVIGIKAAGYFPGGPDEKDVVDLSYEVYLDPTTYLPLASAMDYSYIYDEPTVPIGGRSAFDVEFVPLDSLEADFFEPASIGYKEPDLDAELDALGGTIYWLGKDYAEGGDFPALVVDDTFISPQIAEGGYLGIVYYRLAENEFGETIDLHEYWADPGRERYFTQPSLTPGECLAESQEVQLDSGRGYVFGISYGEDDGCTVARHYQATAIFDETAVSIIVSANTGHPFDSAEAMEYLLRGLKKRE